MLKKWSSTTNKILYLCLLCALLASCVQRDHEVLEQQKKIIHSNLEIARNHDLHINQIQFINKMVGWATSEQGSIVRSTDGGVTWEDVTPTELINHGLDLHFTLGPTMFILDENSLWFLVRDFTLDALVFYKTVDGGKTWSESDPLKIERGASIYFSDQNHGWAMASIKESNLVQDVEIYHTKDGGKQWNLIASSELGNAGDLGNNGLKTNRMAFLDSHIGWIAPVQFSLDPSPWILKSSDGGRTWIREPLPSTKEAEATAMQFHAPKILNRNEIILFSDYTCTHGLCATFYTSHNQGETWEIKPTIPYSEEDYFSSELLYDFIDLQHGWISTPDKISYTDNGLENWVEIATVQSITKGKISGEITALDFVDRHTGWLLIKDHQGQNHLYKTEDGGQKWVALHPIINKPK